MSSVGKNSSGRSGSVASSRSTSFSLPNDSKAEVKAGEYAGGDSAIEDDEPKSEEGAPWTDLSGLPGGLTRHTAAAKHAEFIRARIKHYSQEAEAMKVGRFVVVSLGYLLCRKLRRWSRRKKSRNIARARIAILERNNWMGMVLQTVLRINEAARVASVVVSILLLGSRAPLKCDRSDRAQFFLSYRDLKMPARNEFASHHVDERARWPLLLTD